MKYIRKKSFPWKLESRNRGIDSCFRRNDKLRETFWELKVG